MEKRKGTGPRAYLRWKPKFLDGKEIWYYYHAGPMGKGATWKKVQAHFNKTRTNPETGKGFNQNAYYKAAWRWALMNWDEAKKILNQYRAMFGEPPVTVEELKGVLALRVRELSSKEGRDNFYEQYPEYRIS